MSTGEKPAPGPRRSLWLAMLGVALLVSLLLGEILLRAAGREPWRAVGPPAHEPILFSADPALGWRLKPGRHRYRGYSRGAPPIRTTLLEDGSRTTGFRGEASENLLLLGGSFVQGWGLSDEQTLAWQLQKLHPGAHVLNYGTGGYGTYQSLLLLEEILATPDPPEAVVYGFVPLHEMRNVAEPGWLHSLALGSRSGLASVPFASLDPEGRLVRHPPARYPTWPLREQLSLVAFAESVFVEARAGDRGARAREVTLRALLEMNARCLEQGSRFVVAFLWTAPGQRVAYRQGTNPEIETFRGDLYERALREGQIPFVDCSHVLTPELSIPGDGHPGPEVNAFWADCLSRRLQALGLLH
ncbi:MAG: hypothetical protein ABFS46_05490 [Myxococcota bacterium]